MLMTNLAKKLVTEFTSEMRQVFESATAQQWTRFSARGHNIVQQKVQDITANEQPGSSLVVLDIEASFVTGQLWEVSVVKLVSGKILIDTTVKHAGGIIHKSNGFITPDPSDA